MALIKKLNDLTPKFGKHCYFSEGAAIIGDVTMGDDCTVWFNAVLRGDVHFIKIGNRVNIQDGSCLHTLYGKAPIIIGGIEDMIVTDFKLNKLFIMVGMYAGILIVSMVGAYVQAIVLQKTGQRIISICARIFLPISRAFRTNR